MPSTTIHNEGKGWGEYSLPILIVLSSASDLIHVILNFRTAKGSNSTNYLFNNLCCDVNNDDQIIM